MAGFLTEAEKALVDYVLSMHWDGEPALIKLNELAYAVGHERVAPDAKRRWMDAWKARERARRVAADLSVELNLPGGIDYDSWRAEAQKELDSE